MSAVLCPWSGAPCCECCSGSFPFTNDKKPPACCVAWRNWTHQAFAARIMAASKGDPWLAITLRSAANLECRR